MQAESPELLHLEDDENENNSSVFIQKLINKVFVLWPWVLLSVVLCTGLAFLKFKLSTPIYMSAASVLVQDDKKGTDFGEASMLQDFGVLFGKSSVDNEAEIFKSRSLMEQVIIELQLNVRYYIEGRVQKKELFSTRPVSVHLLEISSHTPAPEAYTIQVNKEQDSFVLIGDEKTVNGKIGDTVRLKYGKAVILKEAGFSGWDNAQALFVSINSLDATSRQYTNALRVAVANKSVSVINLTLNEVLPEKGEIILNALIRSYLQASINDKSRMADSTVKFIDERLRLVFGELSGIENEIENFKTVNKLTDVSEQAKLLLDNTSEYSKQQTAQEVQLAIVKEVEGFLKANIDNSRAVPSSLVVQDQSFVALVQQYNELQLQREKMLMSQTTEHPAVKTVDEQLRNLRLQLLSSISSIKKGIEVAISELRTRTQSFVNQISKVPAKERVFLDYSRQQAIKQELYLFLLKKREETAISKSSTIANARIIDMAKANKVPIAPNRNSILMVGFMLGLLIPFAISYGRDFLNNRISSQEDIAAYTDVPILAEIGHHEEENVIAINATSRTLVAEHFRALRTNLQYVLPQADKKLILITSSMSGEGKSFLSINLSASLGLAGKKVILLELDLRRPKISEDLKLQKSGFTNLMVSEDLDWKKWIQRSALQDGFDVLSSGPLPPNPSEILMLPKVETLFNELRQHYDYIIIDSAPIGLVTDAQIIASYADLTLYIVRHHFTYKQQLKAVEKLYKKRVLPKMNIIVNDIILKKPTYGYGYGYDFYLYGYDSGEKKTHNRKGKKK
ncbi:capsular exopolysaccharide synthesis family protein [Filimonas zeae]|uniref:non-specific protein-tyrosine kinase n=1 Tax=Filimonas zeae TaxID=1737353 RepID=A0A917ILT0_9BACT|nr:polysaccharide biosynthesis tyrosine autokinase [Filimonas zeae]MDR6336987.1 capsular exopolysaccharide synthesis family protein [Filimonas zeae]GGH56469.1 tyrosine protein kinase [Filimonas zeae]